MLAGGQMMVPGQQLQMQVQQGPFGPMLGAVPRFRWQQEQLQEQLQGAGAAAAGGGGGGGQAPARSLQDLQAQLGQGRPSLGQLAGLQPSPTTNLLAHPLLGGPGGLVFMPRMP